MRRLLPLCVLTVTLALPVAQAQAETVEEFDKGRQVTVIVTGATGSIYDLSARLVTKYMSEYLPGKPTMVIKMMIGGGHLIGTQAVLQRRAA